MLSQEKMTTHPSTLPSWNNLMHIYFFDKGNSKTPLLLLTMCKTFIFYFKLIYLNWRIIVLQYCGGFCHKSTWISQVHTCPPILNPSPTTLPYPSGLSQSTGFEFPASCIELALVIYFNMAIYMFQCYSLISSHPRLLPCSQNVCSLPLCLFCCLAYKIIITIFLNSLYTH